MYTPPTPSFMPVDISKDVDRKSIKEYLIDTECAKS